MFDAHRIRECIVQAVAAEGELSTDMAHEVAFHLTDWLEDLEAFVGFCRSPDSYTPAQVDALLLAFLLHAPNHLAAAAKLYAGSPVSDVFGVGAVSSAKDGGGA